GLVIRRVNQAGQMYDRVASACRLSGALRITYIADDGFDVREIPRTRRPPEKRPDTMAGPH
ncbi:MAG TPA: hypothetical protein PKA61_14045, partial [Nitrospira sp.]|nr:hypothetical protein [Nitrospira sp.]